MTDLPPEEPHRCREGTWIVPCDDRCPLRQEQEAA